MAIDWFQATIKKEWDTTRINEFLGLIDCNNELSHSYGVSGYKERVFCDEYSINFNGHNVGMGTNFSFFGEHFGSGLKNQDIFLCTFKEHTDNLYLKYNINRLDLQFTIENPKLLDNISVHLNMGSFVCKASTRREIKSYSNRDNSALGTTFYFGSRTSDRYLRIYDKGAEMGGDVGKLIRIEFEFKGDRANDVYNSICSGDTPLSIFISNLNQFIRFLDISDRDKNKSRRGTATFWKEILEKMGTSAILHYLPKKETSLARKNQWLMSSVAPTLRLVKTDFNDDIESEMLNGGHYQKKATDY